jgi:hypothetical protein
MVSSPLISAMTYRRTVPGTPRIALPFSRSTVFQNGERSRKTKNARDSYPIDPPLFRPVQKKSTSKISESKPLLLFPESVTETIGVKGHRTCPSHRDVFWQTDKSGPCRFLIFDTTNKLRTRKEKRGPTVAETRLTKKKAVHRRRK